MIQWREGESEAFACSLVPRIVVLFSLRSTPSAATCAALVFMCSLAAQHSCFLISRSPRCASLCCPLPVFAGRSLLRLSSWLTLCGGPCQGPCLGCRLSSAFGTTFPAAFVLEDRAVRTRLLSPFIVPRFRAVPPVGARSSRPPPPFPACLFHLVGFPPSLGRWPPQLVRLYPLLRCRESSAIRFSSTCGALAGRPRSVLWWLSPLGPRPWLGAAGFAPPRPWPFCPPSSRVVLISSCVRPRAS